MPLYSRISRYTFSALLTLFVLIPQSWTADPADSQIKSAVYDIGRIEQQISDAFLANKATVRRTLNMLKLTRQRLDESPNKSDPSWVEADQRLRGLVDRLNSGATPPRPAPTPVTPAVKPPVSSVAVGAPEMISQQRVRIRKLKRDIESASESMDQGGVGVFQDAAEVAKMDQRVARFRESLSKFDPFAGDPDVEAAKGALTVHENMVSFGKDYAAKELAALGDVQAKLRSIDEDLGSVPATPEYPYENNVVGLWVVELAKARQLAAERVGEIVAIREKAYLPNNPGTVGQGAPYDTNDLNRMERGYRDNVSKIDANLATFSTNLDAQVSHILHTLEYFEGLDPADPSDQANAFLGAGKASENWQRLVREKLVAAVAVAFDQQLNRSQLTEHSAVLQRVQAAMESFKENQSKALSLARMPEPANTDSELLAIAKQTLARPEYEIGEIKRVVINTNKRALEKETSETEFDDVDVSLSGKVTMSGTKTTYFYQWEEFQVATAEPVGDRFFVYYNTLKYYTKGDSMTPLNKWIVANRFQGIEILESNIDL